MVPGRGFEPRLADSESAVLPLDDPGMRRDRNMQNDLGQHLFLTRFG